MNKENARIIYADIFDLPHHQSAARQHMSLQDRAAQFAPFAALTGYDDMIVEEARLTDSEIELSDGEIALINDTINELNAMLDNGAHPTVTVTYFKPDEYKKGGSYESMTGILKKIDPIDKKLIFYGSENMEDKRIPAIEIAVDKIIQISLQS